MQADWLLQLVEDLERHSTTCVGEQCKERLASGGSLMAWSDELWKAPHHTLTTPHYFTRTLYPAALHHTDTTLCVRHSCPTASQGRVIDATERDERTDAMEEVCPDIDQKYHSPCGYPSKAQPDAYVNEEWFGLFAVQV